MTDALKLHGISRLEGMDAMLLLGVNRRPSDDELRLLHQALRPAIQLIPYCVPEGISFAGALVAIKDGECVARAGWNGKGMWLKLVAAENYAVSIGRPQQAMYGKAFTGHDQSYAQMPWIGMKTADDKFVPWLASQTDVLAEDWQIVEG